MVAIQLPNVPAFVIAYFGVTMMGGVLSTLHMPYRAGETAPLLKHASARAAICAGASDAYDAPAAFLALKAQIPTLEHVIVAGNAPDGTLSFDGLCAGKPRDIADALGAALPNAKVGQMWGMTEMFMGLIATDGDPREVRHNTLGRPSPGTEIRLARADGALAADGEDGEIEVRGCSVFAGYFGNDAANRVSFAGDGWFKTGDLAHRRPDGAYQITGRVKDIINRGGIKINPADIEALIDRHPAVLQSAVAPMPDPVLGERACLFVVPRPGKSLTLAEANAYLAEHGVAKMRWPERLVLIEAMPMTPTRTIVKRVLAARIR